MTHTSQSRPALNIPNLLTIARIIAVPAVVLSLTLIEGNHGRWLALAVFGLASVTDWLDGYLARSWSQQSPLGRMLDPIADKLLVGATLITLVHDNTIDGYALFPAIVVLCREILVSGLREFLAELSMKVHVTTLAKWKTAVQLVALAVLIAGPAGEQYVPGLHDIGIGLLWLAAVLTLWTGLDYLRAALGKALEPLD